KGFFFRFLTASYDFSIVSRNGIVQPLFKGSALPARDDLSNSIQFSIAGRGKSDIHLLGVASNLILGHRRNRGWCSVWVYCGQLMLRDGVSLGTLKHFIRRN